MNIPTVASVNTTAPPARAPEPAERPGHEHDGNSDDKGAATVKPQSAPAIASNGAGGIVNTKA